MKSKAQVSAPIELLVGVFILTLVLIIGFFTYNNMCINQYNQKIKASLSKFSSDISIVFRGSVGVERSSSVDFSTMGCGQGEIDNVRIVSGTPDYCNKNVGTSSCYVLVAVGKLIIENQMEGRIFFSQPLHIPREVVLIHKKSTATPSLQELQDALRTMSEIQGSSGPTYTGWDSAALYEWGPIIYPLTIKKTDMGIEISEVG